jgi:hypothetical protein
VRILQYLLLWKWEIVVDQSDVVSLSFDGLGLEGVLPLMMLVHIIGQYYLDLFDVHVGTWKLDKSRRMRR